MADKAEQSRIGRSNVRSSKSHERRVARLLTDWSGAPFRRRRVEGTDDATRVLELVADVIPVYGDFHFSIECKKAKGFSFDAFLGSPKISLFTEWWFQACNDAALVSQTLGRKVYPMMFFKPHPNWDWVALSRHSLDFLVCHQGVGLPFPHLACHVYHFANPILGNISHSKNKKNAKMVERMLDDPIICRWNDFRDNVKPRSAFLNFPENVPLTGHDED